MLLFSLSCYRRLKKLFTRGCYAERSVLYAFRGLKGVRQSLNLCAGAFNGYYFKAIVVVQVHVLGGNYDIAVIMLDIQQLIDQVAAMMVVNNSNGAGNSAALGEHVRHELLTDKVGNGFGPVGIAFRANKGVELPEKFFLQGDAEP